MQEREGTFFQKQTGFNSISFCAGGTLLNSPFSYAVNARAEYLTSTVFPPFYFGIGATAQLGFPKKDFPYEYKINNTDANPPNLASGILYFPFGVEFSPWNNKVFVKTGFRTGLMITTLAFISGNSYFTGKPAPAFFVEYNAGIIFNFFELEFSCSYNTLGNINQSVHAGYVLRW